MKKKTMKSGLELNFVHRTLKTTGVVLLLSLAFGMYYYGVWPALAFFSGGIWGMINLIFLNSLVRAGLRPDGIDTSRVIGLAVIKFPLLYLAGYFLLTVPQFEPLALLAGFSVIFAVMILKVVARAMLRLDDSTPHNSNLGQAG